MKEIVSEECRTTQKRSKEVFSLFAAVKATAQTLPSPRPPQLLCTSAIKVAATPPASNFTADDAISTIEISNANQVEPQSHPALNQSDMFASLFAGVGSGTMSSIACAPLDLVRTRMQVMGDLNTNTATTTTTSTSTSSKRVALGSDQLSIIKTLQNIIRSDGYAGCFRGLAPTLATVPMFWGLYFPLYEQCKIDLNQRYLAARQIPYDPNERIRPVVHMSSAIAAGTVADFFCNPMFVVRTRMQTEALHYLNVPPEQRKAHGIRDTVRLLHAEGGVPIFWRGFTASLLGLTHVGIQFPVYEWLKAEARHRSTTNEESPMDLLFASGLSKMIATSLTYPHEVIRSRMMDFRSSSGAKRQGLRDTFWRVVQNEGYAALYTGIHVSLVRVVPNCCITFMTYEMILRWAKRQLAQTDSSNNA